MKKVRANSYHKRVGYINRKNHAVLGGSAWGAVKLRINAVMFLAEGTAGLLVHSTSLLADALDMLGDALVYRSTLFVLARSTRWQAGAALAKGGFMLLFGLGVLADAIYKVLHPVMPGAGAMGIVGGLALAANLICFNLLYRHRSDNLNISST
jgi:Co/Zn/Cd efflux system component